MFGNPLAGGNHEKVPAKPKASETDSEEEVDGPPLKPNGPMQNPTLQQRIAILDWHHANRKNQSATERHFRKVKKYRNIRFSQAMLSKWLKQEEEMCRKHEDATQYERSSKHVKQTELPHVTEMMELWITKACDEGVQLTGDVLKAKWRDFEKLAGVPEEDRLKLSNGWLDSIKKRLGLKKWKRHGEAGSADPEVVANERTRVQKLLQESGYMRHEIFNMDETGLFYA
jgi:hypothetical protein